jgi:thiamine pyrophosphokinase
MIGTSNRVVAPRVRLEFDGPGMLVILPRARLDAAITAVPAADHPASARDRAPPRSR